MCEKWTAAPGANALVSNVFVRAFDADSFPGVPLGSGIIVQENWQ
jgi:hypothetical protein